MQLLPTYFKILNKENINRNFDYTLTFFEQSWLPWMVQFLIAAWFHFSQFYERYSLEWPIDKLIFMPTDILKVWFLYWWNVFLQVKVSNSFKNEKGGSIFFESTHKSFKNFHFTIEGKTYLELSSIEHLGRIDYAHNSSDLSDTRFFHFPSHRHQKIWK